ncbi:MAG: sialidase family protein, partial [Prosthecobacter sp.]
ADFRIENRTVLTSTGAYHWSQSRPAVLPGGRVIVTTQEIEKRGSHGYRDIYITETTDGAKTWSAPKRIDALNRKLFPDGIERVMGDICPQWHAKSGKLLVTGKCFGFLANPNDNKAKDDRSQERVAYCVYSPDTDQWTEMKIMAMPEKDHAGHPIIEPNSGCNQRWDLPNGEVLLPVRYRADPKTRVYTTVVTRCTFDGETLAYVEHGSEHTISIPRGLYEPSVCGFQGRYFLTMRGEQNGHVARSDDGLNYTPTVEWKFDDGQPLLSANTQQHWITHGVGLYLIYTRKGANNDHVFRNRAPIFIARVDPDKLHLIRATEQILMPETGVDLGGGYAPVGVNANETWVISSEMAFPKGREDEPNRVLLARIIWNPTTKP